MKILITGATGSLGAYLTRHFANLGHEIIASGRIAKPPEELLKYATYIQADIENPLNLPFADACIHTAALSDDKSLLRDLYLPNVEGTKHIAEATKNYKRFIHISSSSVYLPSHEPIKEEIAGKQNNNELSDYGKSKLLAEEKLMQTTQHEACFILRARAFYGEGDKLILPRLLKLVKNETLQLPGSLQVNISMTHFKNIAHAIELCLLSERKGINIYNISDETVYLLIDVMRKFTSAFYGKKLNEKSIPITLLRIMAFLKLGGITKLLIRAFTQDMVLDISKIKTELGYKEQINIDSSLESIALWVQKIGGVEVLKKADKQLAWKN